ncbi:peroxisome membrane protein [Schizophyllum commune]
MKAASALDKYEAFLISNVSTISTLESSLRSLTWFLPGRFKDAELVSEALSASLNALSLYHDTLLTRVVAADPKYRPLIPTSLHTRFTRAWSDRNAQYKWLARSLELIRFTELMLEMILKRKTSEKTRWRGIVFLEAIKAILRFLLLKITRRPILSPPIPEREFDPESLSAPQASASVSSSPTLAPSSPSSSPPATPEHLKNNQVPLPPHPLLTAPPISRSRNDVEDFLLPKALTPSAVKPPLALVRPFTSPTEWLAEIIYVLRPLIYASMMMRDRKSSRPLVTALMLELLSRNLRRAPPPSAALEREEYARRDRDMLWYLFRGTLWQSYTRPKLEAFADATAHRPVLGLVGSFVRDWVPLIDEYYYYTAP